MDQTVTDVLQSAEAVSETREEALTALIKFLQQMEEIGCGPAEQWERVQALQDEAFKQHLQ